VTPYVWPALVALVASAGGVLRLLLAEQQGAVIAIIAVAGAVMFTASRFGWIERVRSSGAANSRTVILAAMVLVTGGAFVMREHNFALLMLCTVMLMMVAGLGLTLQFGHAGVVNFAGAAFFGIGAYAAAVLATKTVLPHPLVIIAGGAFAALIGSVLVLPLLRTRGHYAALITIAFGILFKTFLEVNDALGGPQGLKVPGFVLFGHAFNDPIAIDEETEWSFYLAYAGLSLVIVTAAYALVRRLERSWIGLAFDAVRIDETAAAAFGVNVAAWKIAAFSIGNFLIGVAGAAYAMMTGFVAPTSFTFGDSLILVSIVILGGLGSTLGLIPAALIVVVLPEKLQAIQEYRFLLFALLVIVILLVRPGGLLPRAMRDQRAGSSR
jgi:ABC-type branched-subunit amino acid transport system permease subunit